MKKKNRNKNIKLSQNRKKNRKEARESRKQRKQQRIERMSSQLAEAKETLFQLYEIAWDRLEKIENSGYYSYSADVFSKKNIDKYTLANIDSKDELMKRLYDVRIFLNDAGSTLEGAHRETIELSSEKYKGMFGNQYNTKDHGYKRYNTNYIDDEYAKKAFETYRKIEETRAAEIVQEGAYGSENLIIAIYDAVVRGYDAYDYGMDALDVFALEHKTYWNKVKNDVDEVEGITGILDDNITRWNW